ncbi:MAG: glycoside hydrolase family 65 protein [Propionibacteriaceae bacterium]|nr:glycoside hydrolase family 65 protein [Propionibacteriaceae bacterium]
MVTWLDPLAPFDPLDRDRFPVDEWKLVERGVEGDRAVSATLFSLANGYIGVRGDGDGTRGLGHGTFVNGFHETFRIHHAEQAYGFASVGQVIQGVPDAVAFEIQLWPCGVTVDSLGGATDCGQSECRSAMASDVVRLSAPESTTQEVDFRTGVWTRTAIHTTVLGRVQVEEQRMVCLANRHLVVASVEVTPLDSPCHVSVRSLLDDVVSAQERSDSLDPREADTVQEGGLDLNQSRTDDVRTLSSYHCLNSRLGISVGTHAEKTLSTSTRVVTYVAYHGDEVPPTGVVDCLAVVGDQDPTSREADCARTLDWACSQGWDAIAASQETYLADFWERADVIVDTGDETTGPIQQATRWALFQLAQASAQVQGHGISAKGLSGSGYSGHYFWDTELFVVPFLTYTNPTAAKAVLEFRHAMLPAARRRAAEMDVAGALFPWRTINGEEASAYYPAGTAQYHIDADIAYAVSQYVGVTGDTRFLVGQGLDILVETARMWVDLGFYGDDGYFHIHGVTGPDEYSAVVDDNFYTNAMAKFALEAAVRAATARQTTSQSEDLISVESAVASAESGSTLSGPVDCGEVESWAKAAAAMCLPVADGIHPQDSHFLTRESWDLAALSKDPRPLLLRYHPLVIYRHKVLKQSDVVLALHLLSDWFTPEEKAADFAYYEPLTTGDSTLSVCTQTVIAAEVGREDLALEHLRDALFVDLANFHGNTGSGVHIACAGGVWTALVAGFGGLRDCGTKPALSPRLPSSWKSLTFPLRIGESQVRVRVTHEGAQVTVVSGDDVDLPVA